MRFNTRDINTSIRIEAGGTRWDPICYGLLTVALREGQLGVFRDGFLRHSSTVPAGRDLLPRFARARDGA